MTPPRLTIERVNPLHHEHSIKALFAKEGEAGSFFAPFFDRAYRDAVAEGAWSWIARDAADEIVMHMACFPHRFQFRREIVLGGLGVNLMVARPFRALLPALKLVRHLTNDAQSLGYDFLYADPNAHGRTALKHAGFIELGNLERYVIPIAGRTALESLAVAAYRGWLFVRRRPERVLLKHWAAADFDLTPWAQVWSEVDSVEPIHPPSLYRRRLRDYPSPADHWFTDHADPAVASTAVLVRMEDGVANVWAVRTKRGDRVPPVLAAVANAVRTLGAARFSVSAMVESATDIVFRQAGFARRNDLTPVLIMPLTARGKEMAARPLVWRIGELDCDRGG
jgi:hypothetical protein